MSGTPAASESHWLIQHPASNPAKVLCVSPEKVLAELTELTGSRDEPGGEVEPHDELTYELVNKMWIRLGDVERASAILAEGHAACGWGRKKLRRKVYGTLLRLYDEAEADAERAEEAERLHLKAVAYFCALHGRGLTDRQSCRLALRRCRQCAHDVAPRQQRPRTAGARFSLCVGAGSAGDRRCGSGERDPAGLVGRGRGRCGGSWPSRWRRATHSSEAEASGRGQA